MKTVLVTTTISIPEVLREYRRLGPDVEMIIAGDRMVPAGMYEFCDEVEARYINMREQEELYPALSDAIGWNSIQRRNIAILEAAKLEPDVIVSIDDDNWPMGDYFTQVRRAFSLPHSGNVARGGWFNIGEFATERYTYRGYPYRMMEPYAEYAMNGEPHSTIGIVNGLIFGDPDINAEERIDTNPRVSFYTPPAQRGIALNPRETWSPINAQNTAYRAELAPLMLQLPKVGRYDDIWGSYIAQRVLQETDQHVLFGQPFVKQKRHEHDLEKDLADEQYGMAWTLHLAQYLRAMEVPQGTVLERLGAVLQGLQGSGVDLPFDFFHEWLEAW